MYVGLFVRDKCERLVNNQSSKDESVQFSISSREVTREKVTCEAHDWELKNHARLSNSRVFREKSHPAKYLWKIFFGKKLRPKFVTHTINTLIAHES